MNQYKNNHEFYQSVFDEVHASEKLIMKVQNMTNNNTKKKTHKIRKVALVAAAMMSMLIISNAIVYAATGATWVEHVITAKINGQDGDAKLIDKYDENGNRESQRLMWGDGYLEYDGQYAIDDNSGIEIIDAEHAEPSIVKENDKVFLNWPVSNIHEDITEDFSDGQAEVTVVGDDNVATKFTITGTTEKYKITTEEFEIVLSEEEPSEFLSE